MKVAIVHDWLTGRRGGEKVLESLCRLLPDASVFTLVSTPAAEGILPPGTPLTPSWLNRLPAVRRYYRALLPLMPRAVESFDLRRYDLVVSSSHAVAKGARVPAGVPHVCYCHTPMRYLWEGADEYLRFGRWLPARRAFLAAFGPSLRRWDLATARGVTHWIANSENVRGRIRSVYGRNASVIYPPVETGYFTPGQRPGGDYYLVVCALEPYKRVDLAIRAMNRLGRQLVVAGSGTQADALKRIAGRNVEFTGWVSDKQLRELYRNCRALLFPGLEDFGIVPVEAQACGRPVVAYGRGGALETVLAGLTGVFFDEPHEEALASAVLAFEQMEFDPARARQSSLRFSRERFEAGFVTFLRERGIAAETEAQPGAGVAHPAGGAR